ncbi:MAG: hypothetical protein JST54_32355 [Deltaproteobacteria bacterium]|nr:hypothetical protein [Deltaproteobacteria bacterium]
MLVDLQSPGVVLDRLYALNREEVDLAAASARAAHSKQARKVVATIEADHQQVLVQVLAVAKAQNLVIVDPLTLDLAPADRQEIEASTAEMIAVQTGRAGAGFDAALLTALEDADKMELRLARDASQGSGPSAQALRPLAEQLSALVHQEEVSADAALNRMGRKHG